jgi:ERCC4-related helicase
LKQVIYINITKSVKILIFTEKMTTLEEIIEHLENKAKKNCQPSMDGSREKYYEGLSDAYMDCANILKKFLEQEIDEEELDNIAKRECENMLDKNICSADDIFEFYKAGWRNK